MPDHIAGDAQLQQLLQAKNAKILSSFILGENWLKKCRSVLDMESWRKLIDSILKRVAVHGAECLADRADHESLLAQDPLDS